MMKQETIIRNKNQIIEWCAKRQVGGFQVKMIIFLYLIGKSQ